MSGMNRHMRSHSSSASLKSSLLCQGRPLGTVPRETRRGKRPGASAIGASQYLKPGRYQGSNGGQLPTLLILMHASYFSTRHTSQHPAPRPQLATGPKMSTKVCTRAYLRCSRRNPFGVRDRGPSAVGVAAATGRLRRRLSSTLVLLSAGLTSESPPNRDQPHIGTIPA